MVSGGNGKDAAEVCEKCGEFPVAAVTKATRKGREKWCGPCRDKAADADKHEKCNRMRKLLPNIRSKYAIKSVLEEAKKTDRILAKYERPRTRGDCLSGGCNAERPCPFVSCKYHLGIDVTEKGKVSVPIGMEPWEVPFTCALDIADMGGLDSYDAAGDIMLLTRERVRQIADVAYGKIEGIDRRLAGALQFLAVREEDSFADAGIIPEGASQVRRMPKHSTDHAEINPKDAREIAKKMDEFYREAHRRLVNAGWIPVGCGDKRDRVSSTYKLKGGEPMLLHDALILVTRKEKKQLCLGDGRKARGEK